VIQHIDSEWSENNYEIGKCTSFFFKWLFWIILGNKYRHVLKNICETCYCGHFFINIHYIWSFLLFQRWSKAGLPFLNFQMGCARVGMRYSWNTIVFIIGYILGVHSFPSAMEGFVGKAIDTKHLLQKTAVYSTFSSINQLYCSFRFRKKPFHS